MNSKEYRIQQDNTIEDLCKLQLNMNICLANKMKNLTISVELYIVSL